MKAKELINISALIAFILISIKFLGDFMQMYDSGKGLHSSYGIFVFIYIFVSIPLLLLGLGVLIIQYLTGEYDDWIEKRIQPILDKIDNFINRRNEI